MKTLAILVGGGPAPGINAVIAAAAIEARNQGLRALGLLDGYKWLMRGDLSHVQELDIVYVPPTILAQLGYFIQALLFPVNQVIASVARAPGSEEGAVAIAAGSVSTTATRIEMNEVVTDVRPL